MGRAVLDTTVLIDALRGRGAAERLRHLLEAGDEPYACIVNIEELIRGMRPEDDRGVRMLLNGLRLAPLGRRQGEIAGAWRRDQAARGTTLSQADCLVAAAALGVGARVITGNPRHFPMEDIVVEHWAVGE